MEPDFYEILDVARTDSQPTIRAAYLALMKQVHPDRSSQEGTQAEGRAKRINEAFAVLKDPAKRALYDAELERNRGTGTARMGAVRYTRPAMQRAPVPAEADPRRPPSRRGIGRGLFLILLLGGGVMAGAWHYRDRIRNAPLLDNGGAGKGATIVAAEQASYERPILEADIIEAIADSRWILDYGTGDDAVQYSRSCFSELRAYPILRLLDRCVAFDFAWKHQLRAPLPNSRSDYFEARTMKARHLGNARSFPEGKAMNEARLDSLETRTVAALARLLEGPALRSGDGG